MSGEADARPKVAKQSESPVLLLVEDEALIRMDLSDFLRDCGYRVIDAGTADEAIEVMETTHVDFVLTDVNMPGSMNGFGVAQWVRAHRPGTPVMLASGVARKAEHAASLCEDVPMMSKPYQPAELLRDIRAALAARDSKSDDPA